MDHVTFLLGIRQIILLLAVYLKTLPYINVKVLQAGYESQPPPPTLRTNQLAAELPLAQCLPRR